MVGKLETPEGIDKETFVSYSPEPDDLLRKPIEIKGGLKALKDKGLKITNYVETDGKGRRL
jgi:hypothetical protein